MPCIVWCDRVNYPVAHSQEEIEEIINDPCSDPRAREGRFVWLNMADMVGEPSGERTLVRLGAVSSVALWPH